MFRHRVNWIGLTATPFAKGMAKHYIELNGTLFQDMVIAATIRELIDQGSLVDCDIYAPNDPDLTGVKLSRNAFGEMDYNDKQLGEAVDKHELIGDIVKHWFKLAKDKKTVVFATNVNHSKHIVEQFKHHGIKAEHIDGYMTQEEKQPILERFISGETLIISNVAMLKEGWDVPECEVMILAKPTKSLIAWVQMVGRILRPFAEKTHGIVLDHSGSVARLGYPTDDLPLQLCDGTEKKASKEREKPKEHKCPKCHFVKKSRICPKCGFEPELKLEIEVIDGELTKLERFSKADKQTWYSQLLAYAHNKGYSRGWVSHKYREKFGVWPKSLIERVEQPSSDVLGWLLHKQIAYAKSQEKVQRRVKEEPEHDIGKLGMLKQMIRGNHA
jgi:superfamily II DNA or RNA helicase